MCEFDQNEHTYFSVYFDELEHYFTKNDQKQHTWGISKRNIQVMIKEIASWNLCDAWWWNRITTTTRRAILLIFTKPIPNVRIEILRSEVKPSASKRTFLMSVNFKFSKKADFSGECCCKLNLKLLFLQFVLDRLAHELVYRLATLVLEYAFLFIFWVKFINSGGMSVNKSEFH